MVPKSTKNAPRTTPEPILERMLAHLGALAHHLASLVRHLGANMCNNSKQNVFANTRKDSPQDASAAPSKHPKSTKNKRKPNMLFIYVFHSPAMVPKSITPCTHRNAPKAPKILPALN